MLQETNSILSADIELTSSFSFWLQTAVDLVLSEIRLPLTKRNHRVPPFLLCVFTVTWPVRKKWSSTIVSPSVFWQFVWLCRERWVVWAFFLHLKKKKLCCIISTHTHKPDRCQASIVACDTVILAFMIWNKQTSCFKFFLQYHTAIIFAALYRKPVYVCRFCTGGSDTEWYKAFILLWYLSP